MSEIKTITGYTERAVTRSGPLNFVLSTESEDRMGDIIRAAGWQLDNFRKNPVMLWGHDGSARPPIGSWRNVRVEGRKLLGTATFDSDDPFAASIEDKFRRGYLNAVSVGFRPLEVKERKSKSGGDPFRPALEFVRQELLEVSAVSIPANAEALVTAGMRSQGRQTSEERQFIEAVSAFHRDLRAIMKGEK